MLDRVGRFYRISTRPVEVSVEADVAVRPLRIPGSLSHPLLIVLAAGHRLPGTELSQRALSRLVALKHANEFRSAAMTQSVLPQTHPQWPSCTRCGQAIQAGDAWVVAGRGSADGEMRHVACPCPSCGKDTRRAEEWSTGQCDDCFVESQHDAEPQV